MRPGLLGWAVVVVLAVDAVLLALTELAWLTTATAGGNWVPVSVVLAAVVTPLLVRAADRARPRTSAPMLVLACWAVPTLVVGGWSPAGDGGVLPQDPRAILLLAAGLLPGVIAALRRPAAARATPGDAPSS